MICWTSFLNKPVRIPASGILLLVMLVLGGCLAAGQQGRLVIETLDVDRHAPQSAQTGPITWRVKAHGGKAPLTYAFKLVRKGGEERFVQQGSQNTWEWLPTREGEYLVKVVVTDSVGNRAEKDWTVPYEVLPPLSISLTEPGGRADQYLLRQQVIWNADVMGGIRGKVSFYQVAKDTGEVLEMPPDFWGDLTWQPEQTGFYRFRAVAIDSLGNQEESAWSDWREVVEPLSPVTLTTDTPPPYRALNSLITWQAVANGGLGEVTYEFRTRIDGRETVQQRGPSPAWEWRPRRPGVYRVSVRAWDETERILTSDWTLPVEVLPSFTPDDLIAFLPVENLSNVKAPVEELGRYFSQRLVDMGLNLLEEQRLSNFMRRHRMRDTGGIDSRLAKALWEEEGVDGVLITSLESYLEGVQPRIAITSRLVSCRDVPRIAWIDGVGLTGEDNPGWLGLTRIREMAPLQEMAMAKLLWSIGEFFEGRSEPRALAKDRYHPGDYYLASDVDTDNPYKIAIVPFLNRYARRNAGFVVPLHIIKALHQIENLEVIEPGLVREQLLKYRMIMRAGPSLAASDVLASENTLGADLILSGQVFDYQDQGGTPKIDFSTRLFSGPERRIVWWSKSDASGDDGVYFYDVGRVRSTHVLMEQMSLAISDLLFP